LERTFNRLAAAITASGRAVQRAILANGAAKRLAKKISQAVTA
jgi:hypothetical protein